MKINNFLVILLLIFGNVFLGISNFSKSRRISALEDKVEKLESPEYAELLKLVQPAIDHHYSKNTHHPEHYSNGISGFDLFDLLEYLVDCLAATHRNKCGNIHKSIEHNKTRHGMSDQLAEILTNTVNRYKWS